AVSGTGGLTKTGAGIMKLNNAANSFSGPLEIQNGGVRFNIGEALTSHPALTIDGGTFDVQSFNQTVGAVTMTKGRIAATTGTPGTVTAPSYAFNVGAGDSAQVFAGLLDTTAGPSPLSKTGAGSAT